MRRILSLAAVTLGVGVMLLAEVMPASADMRGRPICRVPPSEAVVITWQNRAGRWFCCGPVQCTLTGEKDEEESIGYCENKTSTRFRSEPEGRLQYVCEVPVRRRGWERSVPAHFYRLHADQESWDVDPRQFIQ